MPPAWYENANEGDEHDVGGTKWYVKEVNGSVIWWARSRYGKAEACSQRQGPQGGFVSAPHPYAYNPYASPIGQAYGKAQQKGSTALHVHDECEFVTKGVKPGDVLVYDNGAVWKEANSYFETRDFSITGDVEFTFNPLTVEMLAATAKEFHETVSIPEAACRGQEIDQSVAEYWQKKIQEVTLRMLREYEGIFADKVTTMSGCPSTPADACVAEQLENDH